ncbi:MAG: C1 family peptidase [Bdellovibrionota bacterium]|nr:C1 family peptidase [Bdellovibrionota bacterium]
MISWVLPFLYCFSSYAHASALPLEVVEIRKAIESDFSVRFGDAALVEKRDLDSKEKAKPQKELSPGEKKIQAMLERNRARIKARYETEKKKPTFQGGADQWAREKKGEILRFKEDRQKEINQWKKAKVQFLKDLPTLKKELTPLKSVALQSRKEVAQGETSQLKKDLSPLPANAGGLTLVKGSFVLPIKSQGKRPTCSAFAAIRAIEILAGRNIDLSEQYFYYASKPKCQGQPCSKAGSWPYAGFMASKNSSRFDIPLEEDCPYQAKNSKDNQTQVPLSTGCQRGSAKVQSFSEVADNEEILSRLSLGQPVIGGFKLSENFFINDGHVFHNSSQSLGKGIHAQGHALLLVGLMDLPEELHNTQGKKCIITANSWGKGWGKGGYACLSERWFKTYRYDMPFLVLEQVAVK